MEISVSSRIAAFSQTIRATPRWMIGFASDATGGPRGGMNTGEPAKFCRPHRLGQNRFFSPKMSTEPSKDSCLGRSEPMKSQIYGHAKFFDVITTDYCK